MSSRLFPNLNARLGARVDDGAVRRELAIRDELELAQERRLDSRRATDLSDFRQGSESRRRHKSATKRRRKADTDLIRLLLSGLVTGEIVGLTLAENLFEVMLGAFLGVLSNAGNVVVAPPLNTVSVNKASLLARGMGVTPTVADRIAPATPRHKITYDKIVARLADPNGDVEIASELLDAVRVAEKTRDRNALRRAGERLGILSLALQTTADTDTARRGYVRVAKFERPKPRGQIKSIRLGDEDVALKDVESRDGTLVRRRNLVRNGLGNAR